MTTKTIELPAWFTNPRRAKKDGKEWKLPKQTKRTADGLTVREVLATILLKMRRDQPTGPLRINKLQLAARLKVSNNTVAMYLNELRDEPDWQILPKFKDVILPPNIDYDGLSKNEAYEAARNCGYAGSMQTFMRWMKLSRDFEMTVPLGQSGPRADRRFKRRKK